MNKKRAFLDICAMIGALLILVVTSVLLPAFWPLWIRAVIGALISGILFAIYIFARTPDEIIALEQQLENIAVNANKIKLAGKKLLPEARSFKQDLDMLSEAIAQLAVRILGRKLDHQVTEVRRLEILSRSFVTLTTCMTGEVYLRPSELRVKLTEIRSDKIPEALVTIQELNASLDVSQVKRLASAEQELELLAALYEQNSAARNATEILKQILQEPK